MDMVKFKGASLGALLLAGAAATLLTLFSCGDLTETTTGKTLSSISILPASVSVGVGKSVTFSCKAKYSDNSTTVVKPTWSLSGEVGAVTTTGFGCSFRASQEGSGTVRAVYRGLTAEAAVTVTVEVAPGLVTIEVSPATFRGRLAGGLTLTAVGTKVSGEVMTIVPTWTMSGDAIGTLTAAGSSATLEITAQGSAVINCVSGEVTGQAYVTIEGFVVEITVEADTFVDEANPGVSHGGDYSLKAGLVASTSKHFETYVRFPLTAIPAGASIEAAVLKLYPSDVSASGAALQTRRLDSAFTESATWETKPIATFPLLNGVFTAGAYNELSGTPLLTLVKGWVAGTQANYGLAVLQNNTTDGTATIYSREYGSNYPLLRIEYTN
jgi:hypothetical protein